MRAPRFWPLALALAILLAVVGTSRNAWAERFVSGTVIDDKTGAPVVGALVSVGAAEAATDDTGKFRIVDVPLGRLDVVIVAGGYGAYFGSAHSGDAMTVRMQADASTGEVIEVKGRTPTGPPLHLSANDVRSQPGSGNDALRALQSLPGVARTPFGLGGLALRGTAPRDTKVYLDGIEVPLLYHFGGVASFFPTGAIDEITLEPGGASVRYGRGLGGVATVTSKTGRGDEWRVGGELSLIHAAALAEGPGPLDGSWVLGVRRSYFDLIETVASLDLALIPSYTDAQVRWESGDGRWTALLFGSNDVLTLNHDPNDKTEGGIDTSNVKSFSYTSRFARAALRYRAVFGATTVTVMPAVGVDDVNARANQNDLDKGMHLTTVPITLRADVQTPFLGGTILVGLDGGGYRWAYDIINTPPPSTADPDPTGVVHRSFTRWAADTGAFVEQSWFVANDKIELRPGIRGDHFGLSDQWTLDPRLAVHEYLPGGVTLTQSVGVYHEPPVVTDLDPDFGNRQMLGSSAIQAAIGAKAVIGDDKEVSATVYYQHLDQLPVDAVSAATPISANGGTDSGGLFGIARELVDTQLGSYTYREAIGTGYAYGVELIARKSAGPFTGWIAYTYSRSLRQNPLRGDDYYPYVLDQPNTLTILASRTLGRTWRVGGRFRYATGNPFTPVASAVYDPNKDKYVAIDGPLLSERLPDFFQVDIRIDKAWKRSWGLLDLYLDVQNVTNRKNAEGVTYSSDFSMRNFTTGLPVFPSIGVEYIP